MLLNKQRKGTTQPAPSEPVGAPPRWSAPTPNWVVIDAIVAAVRSTPRSDVRGLSWSWGEADSEALEPDVEVAFGIDLDNMRSTVVGILVVPDKMPVPQRWDAPSTPWSRRADRILWRAREQLADHSAVCLVHSFADASDGGAETETTPESAAIIS